MAGIRKNGLVKRLESSFYAFRKSIENFRQANENMLKMWQNDKVFIAPDMDINLLIEKGLSEDEIEEKLDYRAWFCGHWHIDKRIDRMHFLFHSFESNEQFMSDPERGEPQ